MQKKRRAGMRSEAHNTDCIEFMRGLPDKCFSLAVCDPPYGKGNDESLVGGGTIRTEIRKIFQSQRWQESQTSPHRNASGEFSDATTNRWNRLSGGRRERYYTPIQRRHTGNDIQNCWGGVNPKPRNGMSPLRRSSSMNFSVSAAIR